MPFMWHVEKQLSDLNKTFKFVTELHGLPPIENLSVRHYYRHHHLLVCPLDCEKSRFVAQNGLKSISAEGYDK